MSKKPVINNAFYDDLGDRWYTASDDPVALLRAESRLKVPWVVKNTSKQSPCAKVLDVACGAGFLSNALAASGHQVTAIDLSTQSLQVAKEHDETHSVNYLEMDAHHLQFPDATFDVVCAMDFLEHISDRDQIIKELGRVLKPGGIFFFHTFNRNFLSWLIVIKGVEWFVKNTPEHMHTYDLLLKPSELEAICVKNGFQIEEMRGVMPKIWSLPFFKLLMTRLVPADFEFIFTSSTVMGYGGFARKGLG
jgi:2-polyprenyl-6-hydroxyphenyl methylase / 3-demethylubiquinone-9 3-methyltransferase